MSKALSLSRNAQCVNAQPNGSSNLGLKKEPLMGRGQFRDATRASRRKREHPSIPHRQTCLLGFCPSSSSHRRSTSWVAGRAWKESHPNILGHQFPPLHTHMRTQWSGAAASHRSLDINAWRRRGGLDAATQPTSVRQRRHGLGQAPCAAS